MPTDPQARTDIAKLKVRVAKLETDEASLDARLKTAEDKLAQLTPCPDQNPPPVEPPQDPPEDPPPPPDPPPAPPADPDLFLLATPADEIQFAQISGGILPGTQAFLLYKSGTGTLSTPVVTNTNDPNGTIASALITPVTPGQWYLSIVPAAVVAVGNYSATLTVASPNQTNAPLTLDVVTVVVAAPPPPAPPPAPQLLLVANPTSLAFTSTEGGASPAAKTILLTKSGTGTLLDPQVISVTDPSGIIHNIVITPAGSSWNAVVIPNLGKPAGSYSATIILRSTNQTNADVSIAVTHVVATATSTPLTMNLSTPTLSVSVANGSDAAMRSVQLTQSGSGILATPVAGTPSQVWISGVVITGSFPTWNAALTFNTDALAVGSYNATVTFTSPNSTNNPRTLTVQLTVSNATPPSSPDDSSMVQHVPTPHPSWLTNPPDLPQQFIATAKGARTYVSDVLLVDSGNPFTNQANLSAAIVTAAGLAGDKRIRLPLGSQYHAENAAVAYLRKQANATGWIDIEAATAPCAEGVRPTLAQMAGQPIFHCIGNDTNTITCQRGADRYRITGIKNTCETVGGIVYFIVHIHAREPGLDESQTLPAHVPRDIILDRISVEGTAAPAGVGRCKNGVTLNGLRTALVDSIVTGQYNEYDENHGVLVFNTPGPVKIVNNFIDSGSIPILIGGVGPGLGPTNGRPSDLEIRRNHLSHPEAWCQGPGAIGNKYSMKGLFELKNSNRTLIEGNVFERCPDGAQTGMAIVIKSAGDGFSTSNGLGTAHATMRYNLIRNVRHGIAVDGYGDPTESAVLQCNHVSIYHNLFHDVGTVIANGAPSGNSDSAAGKHVLLGGATDELNIRFNTFVSNLLGQAVFMSLAYVNPNDKSNWYDFSDNVVISPNASAPVFYDGGFYGTNAMNRYATTWLFNRNLIVGVDAGYFTSIPTGIGNVTPAAGGLNPTLAFLLSQIDFVNEPADNYRLDTGSPGENIGFGGVDAGADIAAVELATAGVV